MQTTNCCFTDLAALDKFIEQHSYYKDKNLLIQIFSSDTADRYLTQIIELITTKLPLAVVIGSTTDGEICDGKAQTNSTVISFTRFDNTKVTAQLYDLTATQFKLGQRIADDLCQPDTKALILLADGLHTNGDDLLDGLYDINQNVVIAGGLAGDYRCMQRTLVICNNKIKQNAVVACALTSDILIVNTQNLFGWHPIGKTMLVTKAQGNRLYELDGKPLRDVYAKYLGEKVANELPVSAGEYPLIISRYDKNIARAALSLFSDGSMLYAGNFKIGDRVQFGYGHIPIILASARDIIEELDQLPIESIFIYSCSARKYFMGAEVENEILPLELLSTTTGFFTYGEFYHDSKQSKSKTLLLNESMTLLLMSENIMPIKKDFLRGIAEEQKNSEHVYDKLFHLIEATGNELTEINEKLELLVEEKTRQITEKIYFDPVTKLPNRNRLLEDLTAQSSFIPVMLAIINIDDFKQVNDYYGYKTGDQLLLQIAQQLNKIVQADTNSKNLKLYKLPIDEYAIAANSNVFTKDFLNLLETKINTVFTQEIIIDGNNFFLNHTLGFTLGRAESTDYLENIDGILLQANMALREAKDTKARQVLYHNDMQLKMQLERNILWTNKIKQAIVQDRFIPYFQPIYSSLSGDIEKYECLIRMIESDGTIVGPYVFLDIARKAKLYDELTRIMIDKCFKTFSSNKKKFSLNLSIADIENAKTVDYLIEKINEYNVGKQLTLEVLETEGVDDYAHLNVFIDKIKQYGCKIAIDDFGSGYSNFEHLVKMNIDYLKIDGSLIKNITKDDQVKIMVEMIIEFCAKINIKTVAEFVSDEAIYNMLKKMRVDYLQGFYLAEPTANCK